MDRRHALLTLSGFLAAGTLLPVAAHAAAPYVSLRAWKQGTLIGGSFTQQASQAAMTLSQNDKIRQFAGFEIAEQTAVAQVLLSSNSATPPLAPLDQQHQAALQTLRSHTGPEFDRLYIEAEILGHRELLQLQENYLATPLSNEVERRTAILLRPALMEHLALLDNLRATLVAPQPYAQGGAQPYARGVAQPYGQGLAQHP